MSRRQFLAASITASLAAIALAKARTAPASSRPDAATTTAECASPHRILTSAPVDKPDCHRRVTRPG